MLSVPAVGGHTPTNVGSTGPVPDPESDRLRFSPCSPWADRRRSGASSSLSYAVSVPVRCRSPPLSFTTFHPYVAQVEDTSSPGRGIGGANPRQGALSGPTTPPSRTKPRHGALSRQKRPPLGSEPRHGAPSGRGRPQPRSEPRRGALSRPKRGDHRHGTAPWRTFGVRQAGTARSPGLAGKCRRHSSLSRGTGIPARRMARVILASVFPGVE